MIVATLLVELLVAVVTLTLATIVYFKWRFQYWIGKGVPQLQPSIPMGNLSSNLTRTLSKKSSAGDHVKSQYFEAKSNGWKHAGIYIFATPVYIPIDLDIIKAIMTKDFQHFTDRGTYVNERDDPIGAHLFAMGGAKWRPLRAKLTPTFTSGKMKMMFQTLVECRSALEKALDKLCTNGEPVDIKEVVECFTTDVIGSSAFGLECNTFEEKESPFKKYGHKVFKSDKWRNVLMMVALGWPDLARSLRIRQVPKDVADFFTKVVTETVDYRERNKVERKDFLQLLIELKNGEPGDGLTMEEIVAQCFVFFLGGFETSATTMTFALYELAKQQDIQQKARDEINDVLDKHDGNLTYEAVNDMKYLGQVIDETLRMYPPLPFLFRQCTKDYRLPDSDVVIERGTKVILPIWGLQMDPEYFPEPDKFDPERFTNDSKQGRHPYVYLPFGEGPRICIGVRFGIMQTKIGLTALLRNFNFTINHKTRQPLKMAAMSFVLTAEGGVWLDARKTKP